jgi:hypothetical protein
MFNFTEEHIKDKELVMKMLKYEDSIILGEKGKEIYSDDSYNHFTSLLAVYTIHRIVLNHFNFINNDEDVLNYRKIFLNYYKSPIDYDADVINCVAYMRENKCVFYTGKDYNIGDTFDDVSILTTEKNKVNILNKINKEDNYTFIGSFSKS